MTGYTRKKLGLTSALALLAATSDAFAAIPGGGIIVYGPPAESIPTLSGTMLIVLVMPQVVAFAISVCFFPSWPIVCCVSILGAGRLHPSWH